MKHHILLFVLLFSFFMFVQDVSASLDNLIYPVTYYSTDDYSGGTQNWGMSEMLDGTIIFANNNGLLVKNGSQWQVYHTREKQRLRVVMDVDGKIYCGGGNEFGYFVKKFNGLFEYKPLSPAVGVSWGEIWRIKTSGDYVYFQGGKAVFVFNKRTDALVKEISIGGIEYFNVLDGCLYFQTKNEGFFKADSLLQNKIVIVNASTLGDRIIREVLYHKGSLLVFTLSDGIFELRSGKLYPCVSSFQTDAIRQQVYSVTSIGDKIIVGTVLNGIYILNQHLEIVKVLNVINGLGNNTILSLFVDSNAVLWAGLDNGISRVRINSSYLNYFFSKDIGTGYAFLEKNGYDYWGTNQGLFYSEKGGSKVNLIDNTQGQVWCMNMIGDQIYCGHHKGLFRIVRDTGMLVFSWPGVMNIVRLGPGSDHYLIISYHKTSLVRYWPATGQLLYLGDLPQKHHLPRKVVLDENQYLWYDDYEGVTRVSIDTLNCKISSFKTYPCEGLKELLEFNNRIFYWQNGVLNCYDIRLDEFKVAEKLKFTSENRQDILPFIMCMDIQDLRNCFENASDFESLFFEVKNQLKWNVSIGYVFPHYYVLNSLKGFLHLRTKGCEIPINFKAVITEIKSKKKSDPDYRWFEGKTIPYESNNILFKFNSNGVGLLEFEYQLVGYDGGFSNFSQKNVKEYTNLPEGKYVFQVRCKNGVFLSPYSNFEFVIEPPFYRSRLFYFFYLALFVLMVFVLFWYFRRIMRRKEQK